MSTPRVYVIHENPEWFPPLAAAFEAEGVPVEELLLTDGSIDLAADPASGVYWSRMSASSHTRGHEHSKEYTRAVLGWLERAGRSVVNGSHVLELEVSKVAQHGLLRNAGFDVPRTTAVFGHRDLVAAAERFVAEASTPGAPFITKHNQGGKGLGVRRFDTVAEFAAYVESPEFEEPVDGITLIQEYLVARAPFITRVEFVGGRFVYAVRVDTSAGSFELCPADACEVPLPGQAAQPQTGTEQTGTEQTGTEQTGTEQTGPEQTGTEQTGTEQTFAGAACDVPTAGQPSAFSIRSEITAGSEIVQRLEAFLADQRIGVAGIEFMETVDGRTVVYDINTNTNYNPAVEETSPVSGPRSIARYLGALLASEQALLAV
ncbi:alpha-L-glutamate ligase [Curtobacterium sp. MCBD17_035]|uniref:ATP-grasp domain-containing protein n=1 Tax=Curtobacterium sp. MCBD17_035 TaxID=2175673 RepID=UPI000DA70B1C|nr:alpha-L-glutamate ligase [Curtobacterium sp. MCBD17_035]WIB66901.1 alpha-L-glutamate ligase [Curtobacterium sp. MCBD17_035]